jgi:hypothetical protein
MNNPLSAARDRPFAHHWHFRQNLRLLGFEKWAKKAAAAQRIVDLEDEALFAHADPQAFQSASILSVSLGL